MKPKISATIICKDEAHNIEDFAREGASCSVQLHQLEGAAVQINNLCILLAFFLIFCIFIFVLYRP